MNKQAILHRRGAIVVALAVVLAMAAVVMLPRASSAAPGPNGNAPKPFHNTYTVEGACDFPVLIEEAGKVKDIELPGGDVLRIFPTQHSTLTNLEEPSNQVMLRGGGKGRVTPPSTEGGDLLVTVTGHNVLVVPGEGIFEVRKATFTLAPPYDVGSELTILEREGKAIDLCARLA
jgi:hypothetical protein